MTASILHLPASRKREPDGVRLGFDFGRWCAELFRDERFDRRTSFERRSDAEAAVDASVREGLRLLPPSPQVTAKGGAR